MTPYNKGGHLQSLQCRSTIPVSHGIECRLCGLLVRPFTNLCQQRETGGSIGITEPHRADSMGGRRNPITIEAFFRCFDRLESIRHQTEWPCAIKNQLAHAPTNLRRDFLHDHAAHGVTQEDEFTNLEVIQQFDDPVGHVANSIASRFVRRITKPGKIRRDDIETITELGNLRFPLQRPAKKAMDQHQRDALPGTTVRKAVRFHPICSGNHSATVGAKMRMVMSSTIAAIKGKQPMITSPIVTSSRLIAWIT